MNLVKLKSRMAELNMTPARLTRESGVSESTIKRIMRGKTDVHTSTLRMIASAVGMDPSTLIDDTADTPTAFDPTNAPEISAEVLEEITVIEQNDPGIGHLTDPLPPNDHSDPIISPECEIFYERIVKYLREKLDASDAENDHLLQENTELIRANARLIEQEGVTRARNRSLYVATIIACCVAGLCLAGLVAYFVYDILSPAWGMVRY